MQVAVEIFMGLTEAFGRDRNCRMTAAQANKIAIACEKASAIWNDANSSWGDMRYGVACAMSVFEGVVGGYGAEGIAPGNLPDSALRDFAHDYVDFVNRGDTYTTTLLFDYMTGEFHVTSWGDYVEALEQEAGSKFTGEDDDESYDDYMTSKYGHPEWMEGEGNND